MKPIGYSGIQKFIEKAGSIKYTQIRRRKIIKYLPVLLLLLLSACSPMHFSKYAFPYRWVKIIVIHNDNVDLHKVYPMIDEASLMTKKESGMGFNIVRIIPLGQSSPRGFGNFSIDPPVAIRQAKSIVQAYGLKDRDYDMVFGFANDSGLQKNLGWLGTKPFGIIDDDYRRYIVMQHPTVRVIRHEFYHGFIWTKGHSTQLMGSISVLNPSPRARWLSKEDREEVFKNKWRDFSKRVELREEFSHDKLSPVR